MSNSTNLMALAYTLSKAALFKLPAETAHELTLVLLSRYPLLCSSLLPDLKRPKDFELQLGGLKFKNPLGLAAGLDKDARCLDFWNYLPLGHIEVGTVTPIAQAGNPKPRLWRLKKDQSIINAFGFNSSGIDSVKRAISSSKERSYVLGVNIGKNKSTPLELAASDYVKGYEAFAPLADYIAINISSPNTPGLRNLSGAEELSQIFAALAPLRAQIPRPLMLKISPDMNEKDVETLVHQACDHNVTALIATNTTVQHGRDRGGLSGKGLYYQAEKVRSQCLYLTKGTSLGVIGVGGFSSAAQVISFLQQGGKLVQVYTSLIYQGPKLIFDWLDEINQQLS